ASSPITMRSCTTVASVSSGPRWIGVKRWSEWPVRPVPAARSIASERSCTYGCTSRLTTSYADAVIMRLSGRAHSGLGVVKRRGHEAARGDALAIDVHVGHTVQRAEVAQPQPIDLSGAREHVPRFELPHVATAVWHHLDREISDTHRTPSVGGRPKSSNGTTM